jgi:predicted nucleotidyltransferase
LGDLEEELKSLLGVDVDLLMQERIDQARDKLC